MFYYFYEKAIGANQDNIEAIAVSSFNSTSGEVDSRYVNLKYIDNENWIFFTNYNSTKATQFLEHNQISVLLYWSKINIQIRIKAKIMKLDRVLNIEHFNVRSKEKNALAISSKQSKTIESYEKVIQNYDVALKNIDKQNSCPEYWGGFKFIPYNFEFWEGHESRVNKRINYNLDRNKNIWIKTFLQP